MNKEYDVNENQINSLPNDKHKSAEALECDDLKYKYFKREIKQNEQMIKTAKMLEEVMGKYRSYSSLLWSTVAISRTPTLSVPTEVSPLWTLDPVYSPTLQLNLSL